MATDEHRHLANFIKNVHTDLRNETARKGNAESVWKEHCENNSVLQKYAECMLKLATTYWEKNSADSTKIASSRIDWAATVCQEYFLTDLHLDYRKKEIIIAHKINLKILIDYKTMNNKIQLLDVGSCYNPFQFYDYLDVLAVDLCPANDNVSKCDFLNVSLGAETISINHEIVTLKINSYDAVTFCFVLEYLPTSEQRIEACRRAYTLLKPEGLLVIATPDSKHVGANSKIMKCWRYTLANLGFSRIKYNKFAHMHCMAFRKSLHKDIAKRWATLHQEPHMKIELKIPQDFTIQNEPRNYPTEVSHYNEELVAQEFTELPGLDCE